MVPDQLRFSWRMMMLVNKATEIEEIGDCAGAFLLLMNAEKLVLALEMTAAKLWDAAPILCSRFYF